MCKTPHYIGNADINVNSQSAHNQLCRKYVGLPVNPIDLTNIIAEASGSSNMLTEIQSSISVC